MISFALVDSIHPLALIQCTCPRVSATYPCLTYRQRYPSSSNEMQAVFTQRCNKYRRMHRANQSKQWAVIAMLPAALCKQEGVHSIELPHSEGRHLSRWIQKYSLGHLSLLTRPPPSTMLALCFHITTSTMNLQARLAMVELRPQGVQLDHGQSFRRQACKLEALPL